MAPNIIQDNDNISSSSSSPSFTMTSKSSTSTSDIVGAQNKTASPFQTQKQDARLEVLLLPWIGLAVWPLMLALPLVLTSQYSFTSYDGIFPSSWYEYDPAPVDDEQQQQHERPKPLGLTLGILAVAVGQIFVLLYFYIHRHGLLLKLLPHHYHQNQTHPPPIQTKGARPYEFLEGLRTHLSQPEGFILLGLYLSLTWLLHLMPPSYYSFRGGIRYDHVLSCLVIQDGIQYVMHRAEHAISSTFYRLSHKPHHRFTNPRLFDAFNGSPADTIVMILIPLYATAWCVNCNVWSYMAFGSIYANWLTLIHSEVVFPWDKAFRRLGLGTPGDHHVHHKFFIYNYGHLFMWFDMICGTYKNPENFAPKVFNKEV